jgi:hypothetical protein
MPRITTSTQQRGRKVQRPGNGMAQEDAGAGVWAWPLEAGDPLGAGVCDGPSVGAGSWLPDGVALGGGAGADMVADGMADGDMLGGGVADEPDGVAAGAAWVPAGAEVGGAELAGTVTGAEAAGAA